MRILASFALALTLLGSASGQGLVTDRPDHALLATVECDVPGAQVWTISPDGNALCLGPTPYVSSVEFRWGTGWMLKKWEKLKVWSAGNVCRTTYLPTTTLWTVTMAFEVRAPGYSPARVERILASFSRPKDLDWDFVSGIPDRVNLPVELVPQPATVDRLVATRSPSTVMLAGDQTGGSVHFGIVVLESSVAEAEVTVDGAPGGRTPVRLVLREGTHDITLRKAGYQPRQHQVTVKPESEQRLKLTLTPAP